MIFFESSHGEVLLEKTVPKLCKCSVKDELSYVIAS